PRGAAPRPSVAGARGPRAPRATRRLVPRRHRARHGAPARGRRGSPVGARGPRAGDRRRHGGGAGAAEEARRGGRRPPAAGRPGRRRAVRGGRARLLPAGRWSLLHAGVDGPPDADPIRFARQCLRRYGVVVRELLARETVMPRWRVLLGALRTLEARGEIRGGRFVGGLVGEQFALPEAVEALRAVRRRPEEPEEVVVAAADPLNVVGILVPGPRIPVLGREVIAFRDGVPVETGELGDVLS